jgi:hypothetical protein
MPSLNSGALVSDITFFEDSNFAGELGLFKASVFIAIVFRDEDL